MNPLGTGLEIEAWASQMLRRFSELFLDSADLAEIAQLLCQRSLRLLILNMLKNVPQITRLFGLVGNFFERAVG